MKVVQEEDEVGRASALLITALVPVLCSWQQKVGHDYSHAWVTIPKRVSDSRQRGRLGQLEVENVVFNEQRCETVHTSKRIYLYMNLCC